MPLNMRNCWRDLVNLGFEGLCQGSAAFPVETCSDRLPGTDALPEIGDDWALDGLGTGLARWTGYRSSVMTEAGLDTSDVGSRRKERRDVTWTEKGERFTEMGYGFG